MAIKVTITVEITDGKLNGDASTQTLTEVCNMITQPTDWFAAAATELEIATAGGRLVQKVAALCGDVRDKQPDAAGITEAMRSRPLTRK